ncbi:GGDEF domain-containing protein [Methylobrevis pamukkalensis]|uniref:diguanylate cyclase n=1 Tax=Methylobrevis pamukkalensis TaxID=1439726 RepID=A0A1E3H8N4_9HYPH|nr:GGDEF domain-containing protein [Methylobrevis pamukkalensis]ODN71861.1 putative diguanylate cyclase YdaM [Methylobrevis pamukkalensis]
MKDMSVGAAPGVRLRIWPKTLGLSLLSILASILVTLALEAVFVRPFFPGMNLYIGAGIAAGVSAMLATPTIYVFLRMQARLKSLYGRVEQLAMADDLTGLMNRRCFVQTAERDFVVPGLPVGALLIDIDRFKSINDRFGHACGDAVLMRVARAIAEAAGEGRLAARLGGEEFIVLGAALSETEALALAERVRAAVARQRIVFGTDVLSVTVSIGVALAADDYTLSALMSQADLALYDAKRDAATRWCPTGRRWPSPHSRAVPAGRRRLKAPPRNRWAAPEAEPTRPPRDRRGRGGG